jgi:hypothetical protein
MLRVVSRLSITEKQEKSIYLLKTNYHTIEEEPDNITIGIKED